jgi:hypothetical protein
MKLFIIILIISLFQCCLSMCLLREERSMNLYYNQTFTVDSPSYNVYALQIELETTIDIPVTIRTSVDKTNYELWACYPWSPIMFGQKVSVDFLCHHSICNFVYSFEVTNVYSMTPFGMARRWVVTWSIISFFVLLFVIICVTTFIVLQLKKKFVVDRV